MGLLEESQENKGLLSFDPYGSPGGDAEDSGVSSPSGSMDLGQYGGLLSSQNHAGLVGGLADKALGTGGLLSGAYNAATSISKTGDFLSAVPDLAKMSIGAVSKAFGIPFDKAVGVIDKTAKNVKAGMTPEDSMMGVIGDLGLSVGLGVLGSALGPIGALLGGIVGGMVDVSQMTDGLSKAMNDWGFEAQVDADIATRMGLQKMGIAEKLGWGKVEDPTEVKAKMMTGKYESIDDALEGTYGGSSGYGGLGGIKGYGEYEGVKGLGIGQEGIGLSSEGAGPGDDGEGNEGGFGDRSSEAGGMGGV
jgi:hypothetical protein